MKRLYKLVIFIVNLIFKLTPSCNNCKWRVKTYDTRDDYHSYDCANQLWYNRASVYERLDVCCKYIPGAAQKSWGESKVRFDTKKHTKKP